MLKEKGLREKHAKFSRKLINEYSAENKSLYLFLMQYNEKR